jgi:hypothetical protein
MNLGFAAPSFARAHQPRGASLVLLMLLVGACREREAYQPRRPGLVDGEGKPLEGQSRPAPAPKVVELPPPEPPTVYDFEQARPSDPSALSAKPAPTGLDPGTSLNDAVEAVVRARDLGAELSGLLAPVSSCVDLTQAATQANGLLTISVSAYVQGSGRVSRATVTAPGQPASALGCIQNQVLSLTLPGPIPGAPVQVSGSTQVQVRAAGSATGSPSAPAASAVRAQPINPDIAKPDPSGEVAGPP